MKKPISTVSGVLTIVGGALGITALAALLNVATASTGVPASQPIHSVFIPMEPEKVSTAGSFGQTDDGGFVCYGTVKMLPRLTGLTNLEYECDGKKSTLQEHVITKIGGTYLGATFLYKNPTLVGGRGVYTVGGAKPGVAGVLVYYSK